MWAGDWRRAYDYGDPQGEALAVHEAAGLIDVSTLGKLIVRGPEAGEFLDRLYPNRFANLKPGRIRYGVLTSDAGRIMDDGTICRLDDESFYVTTTSSGAGAVEQWFSWWLADWRMQVHAHRRHPGPRRGQPRRARAPARSWAASPTSTAPTRPSPTSTPSARRSPACPRCILRIGFVGEVGYEIHFPAAHGQHVWDAILEAGAEHGIRPFGLEPQRILRLQKLHILVGQDTDSESTPYGAAMPWIVKLDKDEDFIGKWALEHAAEHPSRRPRSSASRCPTATCPTEGAAVLDARGEPVGQVTSARHSRQLGQRHRHGLGAGRAGQRRRRDHHLRRQPHAARRGHDQAVLRPRRRGAALVTAFEFLEPLGRRRRPQPDGGPGARRRRADGGARRLERRRRLPRRAAPTPRSAWADVSHLRKREVTRPARARRSAPRRATNGAWWCRVTRERALGARRRRAVEARRRHHRAAPRWPSSGPLAREVFARFCALDLRPQSLPVGGFRPGSVARTPGYVLREDADRFLMLFGWALGEYMWTVVADAAERPGRRAGGRRRPRPGGRPCVTSSAGGACGARARR